MAALVDAERGFGIGLDVGGKFGIDTVVGGFEREDGVGTVIITDGVLIGVLGPAPMTVDVVMAKPTLASA